MMPVYIHRPGLVSALGCGAAESYAALFRGTVPLSVEDNWLSGRQLTVGRYRGEKQPLPLGQKKFQSENNLLLWQALRQIKAQIAAVKARFAAERIAVVIGTSTTGGDENKAAFQAYLNGCRWQDSGYSQEKQKMSAPADFTAACFALTGLCYGISTACTSGARALISAARLLRSGAADAVICGGADCLSYLTIHGFAALEVLSAGHARPFNAARDGINIGEAAAVFVMTREALSQDALCLLGYGSSSDAYHMSSPQPEGAGARLAIENALAQAKLSQVGWLNLHGTGTVQNDAMEAKAVAATLPDVPCCSTKPLTGHTLGAAGALEAALCWLVIREGDRLPVQPDSCDDPALPGLNFTTAGSRWQAGRRIALSTSFAFGGNNTALIIGEPA